MLLLGVDLAPLAGRLTRSSAHCLLLDIDADALRGLHLNAHTQPVVGDPGRLAIGGRTVDLIVAGDQARRLPRATLAGAIAGWSGHLHPGGHLVSAVVRAPTTASVPADRLGEAEYDRLCEAADLAYLARYADLDGGPFHDGARFAVSVHRKR